MITIANEESLKLLENFLSQGSNFANMDGKNNK